MREVREAIKKNIWEEYQNDPNQKCIEDMLQKCRSDQTKYAKLKKLRYMIKFLYSTFGIKFILDYNSDQIKNLLLDIEAMKINSQPKNKYRAALKDLIYEALDPYLSNNKKYNEINYEYLLSDRALSRGQGFSDAGENRKKNYLKVNEIIEILENIKNGKTLNGNKNGKYERDYIMFKVFISSCRNEGVSKLQYNNIDFKIPYFDTFEKGTKKNASGKQLNRYFLTKKTGSELAWYCIKNSLSNNDFVFDLSETHIRRRFDLYTNASPKDIRSSMLRLWKNAEMDISDRNMLSNHAQNIDGIYSSHNPFEEPEECQAIYEKYMKKIFEDYEI